MEDNLYEERKTPGGYLVKVRLSKMTYVVFTPNGPEVPRGAKNQSIVVPVPKIAFLGPEFNLSHFRLGELNFVNTKAGKMVIPYQFGASNEIKTIFLSTGSSSDVLPIVIYHYNTKDEFIQAYDRGETVHYLVVDESIPRQDMVGLKIRYQTLNIMVIRKKIAQQPVPSPGKVDRGGTEVGYGENPTTSNSLSGVVDINKVRATDIIHDGNLNQYSQNPVFLARIHLRNLDLDKVKQLLLDFRLSSQDVSFIRTFLDVMIRNEKNKDDLKAVHHKLVALNEAFRLSILILELKIPEFEQELEKGMSKEIASLIYALLVKEQAECKDRDTSLVLWEWKLRVKKMMSG